MKGAPEKVLQQCTGYYKQGSVIPVGAKDWEVFSDAVAAMSSRGLRGMLLSTSFKHIGNGCGLIQARRKQRLVGDPMLFQHLYCSTCYFRVQ